MNLKSKETFKKHNFLYSGINYECNSELGSNHEYCDDYCRCSVIVNEKITSINFEGIVKEFCKFFNLKETIDVYAIWKLASIMKLDSSSSWELSISRGYYGEEIDGIVFLIADQFYDKVVSFLQLTFNQKVEFLLKEEYGYILDKLNGVNYKIEDISIDDVVIPNDYYHSKLNQKLVEDVAESSVPIKGLVIKNQDKYVLVDGYHRTTAIKNKKGKKYNYIVAYYE